MSASASVLPRSVVPVPSVPIGRLHTFVVPPVFGDEPQLEDLRDCLSDLMSFTVLSLPDAHASGRLLTDMEATGRALGEAVRRDQPEGPVALLGLSFGASMALEVASQLARAGREIAFLVILDGPFEPPETVRTPTPLALPRRLVKSVVVDAAESLDGVRRLVLGASAPPSAGAEPGRAEAMRRAMLWHLRNKALKHWHPQGCGAPGLHVFTESYGRANQERWAALCPNLVQVHVDAVHEHLLKDDALEAVVSALRGLLLARLGAAAAAARR